MKIRIKYIYTASALLLLLILVSCGNMDISAAGNTGSTGGGSPSTGGGGVIVGGIGTGGTGVVKAAATPAALTGVVPFASAVVFHDLNRNGLLDNGEPFAQTDPQGSYTLGPPPGMPSDTPLLLKVIAGTTVNLATGQLVSETSTTIVTEQR